MDKNLTSWIQITSGQGPDECCWVVARVVDDILKEALSNGYKARIVETTSGNKYDIFKSALIAIEGKDPSLFIAKWQGTIQWIGKSMFRPKHKRKNWFIGINSYQIPKIETIRDGDLKFDKMRSSGPGGQHVNKTESAIRVTHVPLGLTAIAQEERSQHLNRKLAIVRLYERLNQEKEQWSNHSSLERDNPIRSYEGLNFKLKSSLR